MLLSYTELVSPKSASDSQASCSPYDQAVAWSRQCHLLGRLGFLGKAVGSELASAAAVVPHHTGELSHGVKRSRNQVSLQHAESGSHRLSRMRQVSPRQTG